MNSNGNTRTLEQEQGRVAHVPQLISGGASTGSASLNLQFPLDHWEETRGGSDLEKGYL